jgi:hypothetical protein
MEHVTCLEVYLASPSLTEYRQLTSHNIQNSNKLEASVLIFSVILIGLIMKLFIKQIQLQSNLPIRICF